MKNIFLMTAIVMSLQFEAKADFPDNGGKMPTGEAKAEGKADPKVCEYTKAEDYKNLAPYKTTQGNAVAMPGSNNFNACDKMSRGHLRYLYNSGSRDSKFDWTNYIKAACVTSCDSTESQNNCIKEKTELARSCESVTYVMSLYDRNWEDPEQIQKVEANAGTGAQPQQQNGQKTDSATAVAAATSSTLKCKSEGIETLDYIACKKFSSQMDVLDAIQTTVQGGQELIYQDKMMDAQTKYAKEENTATGALKATGESLEMQQNMYQQRTAIDSTKLAYLYSIYNEMPKVADIREKCNGITKVNTANKGMGSEQIGIKECQGAVTTGQGGYAMAQNQSQVDAMRSKLITIATSAGSNAILSNLLGKRADDVKDAIAEIDAFVPTDPTLITEEDALSTYCKLNPGVEKCLTSDLTRTFDTLNDNIITFGEGGTGTSYGATSSSTSSNTDGTTDSTTRSSVTPVGSIIASAAKDNSIEGSNAATVSSGGGGSNGSSGGGLGGGGGGGGGGSTPTAPAQGGVTAAVQNKNPTYGGGAGSISVVGGLGINKAKADGKGEDNPFGKLFGKDAPKGSGVVNFRDIASTKVGSKEDNLFDMISKRYSSVSADKRLLEYELAK